MLKRVQEQMDSSVLAVAISTSRDGEIRRFKQQNDIKIEIRSDPGGKLTKTYNAAWTPRLYMLSPERRLIWLQATFQTDVSAVIRTKHLSSARHSGNR
jgi:peroxiredoxin